MNLFGFCFSFAYFLVWISGNITSNWDRANHRPRNTKYPEMSMHCRYLHEQHRVACLCFFPSDYPRSISPCLHSGVRQLLTVMLLTRAKPDQNQTCLASHTPHIVDNISCSGQRRAVWVWTGRSMWQKERCLVPHINPQPAWDQLVTTWGEWHKEEENAQSNAYPRP